MLSRIHGLFGKSAPRGAHAPARDAAVPRSMPGAAAIMPEHVGGAPPEPMGPPAPRDAAPPPRPMSSSPSPFASSRSMSSSLQPIAPPVDRRMIDSILTPARVVSGLAFVAFSAVSTIVLFANDIFPATGDASTWAYLPDRYVAGIVLAVVLFLGELITAERAPRIYMFLVSVDAFYTARGMAGFWTKIYGAYLALHPFLMLCLVWFTCALLGFLVAYLGERLLFGKRRR